MSSPFMKKIYNKNIEDSVHREAFYCVLNMKGIGWLLFSVSVIEKAQI